MELSRSVLWLLALTSALLSFPTPLHAGKDMYIAVRLCSAHATFRIADIEAHIKDRLTPKDRFGGSKAGFLAEIGSELSPSMEFVFSDEEDYQAHLSSIYYFAIGEARYTFTEKGGYSAQFPMHIKIAAAMVYLHAGPDWQDRLKHLSGGNLLRIDLRH